MSPIPSPTPLRRVAARLLFSPAGLLFGFVVLLIATCPGARGESGFANILALSEGAPAGDWTRLDVPVAPATASETISRPSKSRRSSWRSPTPAERGEGGDTIINALGDSPTTASLVADPVVERNAAAQTTRLKPMTGPTVGIRSKLPAGVR